MQNQGQPTLGLRLRAARSVLSETGSLHAAPPRALHRLSATLVLSQYLLYHLGTMIKCMLGNTDETNDSRVAYTALQHSACTRRTAWSYLRHEIAAT